MTIEDHISNLETIGWDGRNVTSDAYGSIQFAIKSIEAWNKIEKILDEHGHIESVRQLDTNLYEEVSIIELNEIVSVIDEYLGEIEVEE